MGNRSARTLTCVPGADRVKISDFVRNAGGIWAAFLGRRGVFPFPNDVRKHHSSCAHSRTAVLAQLIPLQGGEPITIDRDVTLVGRVPEHCDLVLERKSVSKMHCLIVKTDGLLFVRDLSSTNGTKVNGQRIIRGALLPGDQLSFGGERFRVHMGPSPVAGAAVAAAPVHPGAQTEMLANFVEPAEESSSVNPSLRTAQGDEDPDLREDDLVE